MSTTTNINEQLARFYAGDEGAKRAVIQFAYDRLLELARKILPSFPDIRKNEETAAVFSAAHDRICVAMDTVWLPTPEGSPNEVAKPRRTEPPTKADLLCLAGQHIRWQLIEMVRKERGRGDKPRPRPEPLGPAGSEGGGIEPPGVGTDASDIARRLDVLDAIEKLSQESRRVYDLHIVCGLTLKDIAELLGITYDQTKDRWTEARLELAELLKAYKPSTS